MYDAGMDGSGELDTRKPYEASANSVRFFKKDKLNEEKTKEAGRPIFDMLDKIEIISPGDKTNIVEKWATDEHRREYRAVYQAFLNDQSQEAASGTPLRIPGSIPPERIAEYNYGKVFTCEQLAAIPDSNLQHFGPYATAERARVRDFMQVMKGNAPLAKMRAEIEEKDARLSVLEAAMDKLLKSSGVSKAEILQAVAPPPAPVTKDDVKPKRARKPRKGTNESQI